MFTTKNSLIMSIAYDLNASVFGVSKETKPQYSYVTTEQEEETSLLELISNTTLENDLINIKKKISEYPQDHILKTLQQMHQAIVKTDWIQEELEFLEILMVFGIYEMKSLYNFTGELTNLIFKKYHYGGSKKDINVIVLCEQNTIPNSEYLHYQDVNLLVIKWNENDEVIRWDKDLQILYNMSMNHFDKLTIFIPQTSNPLKPVKYMIFENKKQGNDKTTNISNSFRKYIYSINENIMQKRKIQLQSIYKALGNNYKVVPLTTYEMVTKLEHQLNSHVMDKIYQEQVYAPDSPSYQEQVYDPGSPSYQEYVYAPGSPSYQEQVYAPGSPSYEKTCYEKT